MCDRDVRPVPSPEAGRRPSVTDAELAHLLQASGRGDVAAFGRFYDGTIDKVYAWARLSHEDQHLAAAAVRAVYALAWKDAAGHAASGLSPRAWLLCHGNPGPRFNSLLRNLWETELLMARAPAPTRQAS
jgi:RNA polymerase sigma-70 factor (ECF subfamily)